MFCRCMYGRLINCRGTCVLKGNVYGVTQMSAYCIISAGYVLWGEYWLPKYCRGICKVERTVDFTFYNITGSCIGFVCIEGG